MRKTLVRISIFVLTLIVVSLVVVSAETGYTYDHKGNVIYSTEGFTVNETPYVYLDLGLKDSTYLSSPKDLFVYNDPRNNDETTIYLLDAGSNNVLSRLYLMNSGLKVETVIDHFYYVPSELPDITLEALKSFGKPVIGSEVNSYDSTKVSAEEATMWDEINSTIAYDSLDDLKAEDSMDLYLFGAQSIYRMYKTNTTPYTDYIYICDTGNNQVLVLDADSYLEISPADPSTSTPARGTYKIVGVVTSPTEEIGSDTFRPTNVTADAAGRIYVIANGITNGIMEFSAECTFDRYIGTNYVALKAWDIFWRNFSTESQLDNSTSILPTTFTSMTYKNNMIYTTSYVVMSTDGVTSNDKIMIKKINPSGKDVLRRNGYTVPKGDFAYYKSNDANGTYGPSTLEAIAVNDYGVYTVVDSNRGRLFTYDNEGNLLYISGGTGEQIDKITIPEAIQYLGENVLVLDSKRKAIIIFEPTDIAKVINKAVKCEYDGRVDGEWIDADGDPETDDLVYVEGAYDYWEQVILLNANYEYAYVGIGKHYMNIKDYKTAMKYFKLGYHKIYYGKAYKQYRDSIIKANFTWVACVIFGLIVLGVVLKKVRRKKLGIKEEVMTGIGDE